MRKMGPLKEILAMVPGMGSALKDMPVDEGELDQTEAIIHSMTLKERSNPDLIDASRRRRIARGSGVEPQDVAGLVKSFGQVKEMVRQMQGAGHVRRGQEGHPAADVPDQPLRRPDAEETPALRAQTQRPQTPLALTPLRISREPAASDGSSQPAPFLKGASNAANMDDRLAARPCLAALAGVAWAATGYNLQCLNKDCGYTGKCVLGPTKLMDSIDGYCPACDKWVNLRWKRDGEKPPAPLGKVWVAETGKTLPVYACPNCKGPLLPVTENDKVKDSKYAAGLKAGRRHPTIARSAASRRSR